MHWAIFNEVLWFYLKVFHEMRVLVLVFHRAPYSIQYSVWKEVLRNKALYQRLILIEVCNLAIHLWAESRIVDWRKNCTVSRIKTIQLHQLWSKKYYPMAILVILDPQYPSLVVNETLSEMRKSFGWDSEKPKIPCYDKDSFLPIDRRWKA